MHFPTTAVVTFALSGSGALASAGVSPASVQMTLDPGSSFSIEKVVTTPEIPPKPDCVLLVDITGSMGPVIKDLRTNLINVIATVGGAQPTVEFAVASFGDFADSNRFQVNQPFTSDVTKLQAAVNSLTPVGGRDDPEDWINALYELATGAVTYRPGSSRIVVLVTDNPSHDPSGGHTLDDAIAALNKEAIRVIAVNVGKLDASGQGTKVTTATGGVIIPSDADKVSAAIVSGLKNLDVVVKPASVSCDKGLSLDFAPPMAQVSSGSVVSFKETGEVASDVVGETMLSCTVGFSLNGTAGGDAFVQKVSVKVNKIGCDTCDSRPGKNLCHITTSCTPTPGGTMCLTRPGYKADGANDDDRRVQWRLKWPVGGHEHRIAVKPGTPSNTLCDKKYTGADVCKEVSVGDCPKVASLGGSGNEQADDQILIGDL